MVRSIYSFDDFVAEEFQTMSDLVQWVSDQLHDILGLSDRITSEFLVTLAKKASSGDAFLRKLKDTKTLKIDDKISSFALDLWAKVPHQKAVNPYLASREKEKAAIVEQQKNKSYRLLSDDDDDEAAKTSRGSKKLSKKERDKKERRARMRGNIRKGRVESESSEEEEKPSKENQRRFRL